MTQGRIRDFRAGSKHGPKGRGLCARQFFLNEDALHSSVLLAAFFSLIQKRLDPLDPLGWKGGGGREGRNERYERQERGEGER